MNARILRLDKAGVPVSWLTRQETATMLVKGQVLWDLGSIVMEMRGGYNRQGVRSVLKLPSIVACDGKVHKVHKSRPGRSGQKSGFQPPLENRFLFRRDQNLCLYCGGQFGVADLSRDHIVPLSRGGTDSWTNVVTSCRRCNNRKADRRPEEADMQLLAVPFAPNQYEFLYLSNHNVLADQMQFLSARFSRHIKLN